jgi:hypothetical protein
MLGTSPTSFGFRGDSRMYLVPTRANGQPALAGYVGDADDSDAVPAGLFVLAMADHRIHAITRFHLDELYPRFGLALTLTPPTARRRSLPPA